METLERNIAVVGTGYWGQNLVRNYHALGFLKTVCDTNEAALSEIRLKYANTVTTSNFQEVLSDSEISGVVIALPAALHYEYARKALLAGKDVYVEKPLSLRTEHARDLVQLANNQNRILMVGHLLHYHPAFLKLKKMVHDGDLGKIQYIYSHRLSFGKIRREENSLWSFAPHDISMILSLCNEFPSGISAVGANYLHNTIADVTTTHLEFPSGIKGHIFVSWLHPVKEHKLVIVADKKMAIFDDTQPWEKKIALYPHSIRWQFGLPVPEKAEVEHVSVLAEEPLLAECSHFLDCIKTRKTPHTDGIEGLRVLEVLEAAQLKLEAQGVLETNKSKDADIPAKGYFAHPSSFVDEPSFIGQGTKIWHYCHVHAGAHIGSKCVLGQNVNVGGGVTIGDNVKIQNNVSIYDGVTIENDVFLGPSCVLTNITNPRSQIIRHGLYERTLLRRGATIGANATLVCGITVGRYAFVAAGAVVAKDVPDYALMAGVPARRIGWMSRHGHKLEDLNGTGTMVCPESHFSYQVKPDGQLRCLDLDEDKPLPESMRKGVVTYEEMKNSRDGAKT